jgi:hypothetical protein
MGYHTQLAALMVAAIKLRRISKKAHNGCSGPLFRIVLFWVTLFLGSFFVSNICAAADRQTNLAQRNFQEAKERYLKLKDPQSTWQFGRACFDLADLATNSAQRSEIADQGIAACKQLIARDPNSGPGHYYFGMNLAQVARTRGIGALKIVKEMEREFSLASQLDASFDFGGPDRNLGLLYRDAPAIISVGSRTRAKKHLERAVEIAPDYPENRLNLIESFLQWSDRNGVKRETKALDEAWPRARKVLTGEAWESSWLEWEVRRQKIRKKIEEPQRDLESPAHKE